MKKIITWILLAAMLLGIFAGCEKSDDPTQPSVAPTETTEAPVGENNAAEVTAYLQAIYKDSGAKTSGNFERFGIVRIAGVPYEVVWTADVSEDLVKIIVNDDGTVTIDVNEKCTEDTVYVLTATVTDANGNTSTASWEYLLPGVASVEEMQAIVDQAYALEKGEALAEQVTLAGVIKSIDTPWSEEYQNITVTILIEGREDKPIQCYRLKGEGAKDLVPGDTISVQGIIKNYNGTIEFDAGCQLVTVEKTGTPINIPTDPHEILNDVYALGDNESLPYGPVTLTGRICAIDEAYSEQYGNITVSILIDWYTIKCYRMSGEGVEDLEMNDIITVQGYIKKYNGTREFDKPTLLDVVKVGAYPQPADQVEVVTAAYNLDPGWTLPYSPVTLTGTITKVNYAWSDQYENITVTFVVEGGENMPVECYRMTYSDEATKESIKTLAKGDKITVNGMLIKYQNTKTGATKVEFNYPELISVTKAGADTGTYNKIDSASEFTSAKYVMVVSTGYAPISLDGSWITTDKPVVDGDKVTDSKGGVWTLTVNGSNVKITDSTGATIKPKGGNNNGIASGDYEWAWTCNSDGTFTFSGVGSDTVKLASNANEDPTYGGFHKFRGYKTSTIDNAPATYPCNFTLYKLEGSEFDPGQDTPATPSGTPAALLTSLPADGDVIAIVNSGMAMTATASGKKLAGETASVSGSTLIVTNNVAQLTVSIDSNGYYTFTSPDGLYLTSGSTGNSLSFASAASDYSLWTVESAGNNKWYIKNVNAKYNGNVQSLEYYSGFTTYGHKTTDVYQMELYLLPAAPAGAPILTSAPTNGSTIAVVNSGYAMTATASGKKLAGETATVTNGVLTVTDTLAQLNVSIDSNGYYTFTCGGKYLTSGSTGNSLSFAAAPSDYSLWTVESAGDNLWYIKNVNAKYNGNVQSLEYYSGFTTYGHKTTDVYKMALYLIAEGTGGTVTPDPTPDVPENNDPTPDTELTIAAAKTLGLSKEHNTYTDGKYYITGSIVEIQNTEYGNIVIEDEAGETILIYGSYDAADNGATSFENMNPQPKLGDTIKAYGRIGQFNGVPQMKNGWVTITISGDEEDGGNEGGNQGETTTVTVSIGDYATANGWANGTMYNTLTMNSDITVTATGGQNTGKYYTSGTNWRIYQNESPAVTITAANGKTIVSVKVTYASQNTGVLTLNGSNVSSGTAVTVNGSSVTFSVGNTGTATNGQARITAIEVVYQ